MIGGELGAIVGGALRPQQRRRARVMQVRVVQDGQARISEEIRPEIIVMRRIADLVDRQVVRAAGGAARRSRAPRSAAAMRRATRGPRPRTRRSRDACASAATSSALHAAMPDGTGGIGLNQARRMLYSVIRQFPVRGSGSEFGTGQLVSWESVGLVIAFRS